MKKKYTYVIPPLVGLVIFSGIYWNYSAGYQAKLEAGKKAQIEARNERIRQENLAKKEAVEAAIAAQEKRKQEKREREERDARDKEQRELAMQARVKAREDARRAQDQVNRLKKEIADTRKEIARIEDDRKRLLDEQSFQNQYVKQAESNTQSLSTVLQRIAAADKAIDDAAKAAAAAAAAAAKKK